MPNMGERIVSAVISTFFGALIGFILAWLLGVYSHLLGTGRIHVDLVKWISFGALSFGLLGFIIGQHTGTLIGTVFNIIFQIEDVRNYEYPGWLIFILFILFFTGVLWLKFN